MTNIRNWAIALIAVWGTVAASICAQADVVSVTDWIVRTGAASIQAGTETTNSPVFGPTTPATTVTNFGVMAPFTVAGQTLANDGDFINVTTVLTLGHRSANTGINGLNTQLRLGLFDGPGLIPTVATELNLGMIMEYSNAGGLIREQQAAQQNPFNNPTNTGQTGTASGGSIQGADPLPVTFSMTLTKVAGKLDLAGTITGSDNVGSMLPISSTFTLTGWTPATFTFDRVGFFISNNVNAASATLGNVTVTTGAAVPESRFGMLAVALVTGGGTLGLNWRRRARRRGQAQR